MFVKWKRREGIKTQWGTLSAYLVESVRTAVGPRHKHICYIASIADIEDATGPLDIPARYAGTMLGDRWYRAHRFWRAAMDNLARAGIEGDDLVKVAAALERVVERPPGERPPLLPGQSRGVGILEIRRRFREHLASIKADAERRRGDDPDEE
jgi:hypothetical protein